MEEKQMTRILIAGCGSLGSNIALMLARHGLPIEFTLLDFDRIEEKNVGNQVYTRRHVGLTKTAALSNVLSDVGATKIRVAHTRLTTSKWEKPYEVDIAVDAFDNAQSRILLNSDKVLHCGVALGYGEVKWNEVYTFPAETPAEGCDVQAALTTTMITATMAVESILRYIKTGERLSMAFYLAPMQIVKV